MPAETETARKYHIVGDYATALNPRNDARSVEKYARHLVLRPHGARIQRALCAARVLVVGCGGLGCPCAIYLAASGVGTLGLCDADAVELSNLHRQVGHSTAATGTSKAKSLAARCEGLNDGVRVVVRETFATTENVMELVAGYDLVCDCSDNPRTRYLLSDACASAEIPLVSAACVGFEGQLTVLCGTRAWNDDDESFGEFAPAPCYRCLFPTPPASGDAGTCGASGVLGPLPGIVGTFQALEAMKTLAGVGESMRGKMLTFDALSARPTMTLNMREQRDAACACCSTLTSHDGRFDVATYDYDAFLSSTPCPMRGRKARRGGVDVNAPPKFGAREMPERDGGGWRRVDAKAATTYVKDEGVTVVDVRPKHMYDAAHIPGSISLPIETLDVETWNGAVGAAVEGYRLCFVCAGGNNSQRAAQWFVDAKVATAAPASGVDGCGGLAAMRDAGYDVPRLD